MVIGATFLRVDDPSLLLIAALVILAGGIIAYLEFLPHPGIRFPQNGCTSCAYLGLCLQNQPLVDTKLLRRPGGDLGWLDELDY